MLPELLAERQLLAIESASVPHMTEPGRRDILGRLTRRLRGAGTTRARSAHDALMQAGVNVVEVPAAKTPRRRRDKPGQDEGGKRV